MEYQKSNSVNSNLSDLGRFSYLPYACSKEVFITVFLQDECITLYFPMSPPSIQLFWLTSLQFPPPNTINATLLCGICQVDTISRHLLFPNPISSISSTHTVMKELRIGEDSVTIILCDLNVAVLVISWQWCTL